MNLIPSNYQLAPDGLAERVILITGASGSIGAATARACAAHGATVVLLGRTVSKLEKVYDIIESDGGPKPAILPLNLMTATWRDYEVVAETLSQEFQRLDGILHTAAHFRSFTRLEDLEPREWMDGLQVNLTAPYTLTRLCLPLLRRSADASVVFMTDRGGMVPKPFHGIYGITKAATETMLRTWALELENEPQLRFNSYFPGPTRSALRARGYMGDAAQASSRPPEEAVPGLLWLLGPDSRGITGQTY